MLCEHLRDIPMGAGGRGRSQPGRKRTRLSGIIDVAENDDAPPRVSENKWLVWDLKPDQIAKGAHTIKVVLVNRDSRIKVPLTIDHVDLHVRY